MNTKANLIIANGKIITSDTKYCKYNIFTHKYDITFYNNKTYSYNYLNVRWLMNPKVLNPNDFIISYNGKMLYNISEIYIFDEFWHIIFENGCENDYVFNELSISKSVLRNKKAKNIFEYLFRCSELSSIKSTNGENLLSNQYKSITYINENTVLASYLAPENNNTLSSNLDITPIFPFGCNRSQIKAVKNALENKVSIIEGPPGTGKTQTILNIIANLILYDKTVQVVSNNNTAIKNILEKFKKYNLDFIIAMLGKDENKNDFIKSQIDTYPNLNNWKNSYPDNNILWQDLQTKYAELNTIFEYQERIAIAKQELNKIKTEWKYFSEYLSENEKSNININLKSKLKSSDKVMQLWQESQFIAENFNKIPFIFKLKCRFLYGIKESSFYKENMSVIILILQTSFYKLKINELTNEIDYLQRTLKNKNAEQLTTSFTKMSMKFLCNAIYDKYKSNAHRKIFNKEDLWRKYTEVQKEYPVILSTTFSSRCSLNKNANFDYVIMDESSQVDIATGALAISNANNAVIVGDTKQLPNVMTKSDIKKAELLLKEFEISPNYDISRFSFLQSISNVIPTAPRTLLKEHYRCHPKIINFCNQKFYNGELIIMTKDNGEKDVLSVIKSAKGNHAREHYNQRQIDIINEEILPKLSYAPDEIGIIAPYNTQVNELYKQISNKNITIATVHKFQGREKSAIILTTVDNEITDFVDDPYLLNVAISRAKNNLCIVTSGNEVKKDSNISDLINYIEYQNFSVSDSKLYSVFDYLYSQYTSERILYLKNHKKISEYDSENLMYSLITDTIKDLGRSEIGIICHQPLNMIIRDTNLLNVEEYKYAMNKATHLDFLLYNHITQKIILVVEVDGYNYHKIGTQQFERDKLKNSILTKYNIPYIRFSTNGNGEKEKLINKLNEILN